MLFRSVDLTEKAPKVIAEAGYEFKEWDSPLIGTFSKDTYITAKYKKSENIIVPDDPTAPPAAEYVKVRFDKGANGSELVGKSVFHVKKNVDLVIPEPKAIGKAGYKFKAWNKSTSGKFTEDTVITATYSAITEHKVIYEADGKIVDIEYVENNEKPAKVPKVPVKDDYKFVGWQEDGVGTIYLKSALENFKIKKDTKFVAKYEAEAPSQHIVTFEVNGTVVHIEKVADGSTVKDVPADPTPAPGRVFLGWKIGGTGPNYGKDAVKTIPVNRDTAFKATFRDDSNILPGNPDTPPIAGYVKVTFKVGEKGKLLEGNTVFQVKKDTEVDLTDEAPKAIPEDGYKFNRWDKSLEGKFTADTDITAEYEKEGDIVIIPDPEDPIIPPTPEHVKVTFKKGTNGDSLVGNTAFYVKKDVVVDLTAKAPKVIPEAGYEFKEWNSLLVRAFNENTAPKIGRASCRERV